MIDINKNKLSCNTLNAGPLPVWGDIVGDITKQEDLKALLDSYVDEPELLAALLNENTELKRWVEEQGYLKEHQSLAGYATESWVENKHYLTEHQDISNLATKVEVDAVEAKIPDVSGFAKKSEIPSLDGYATESWVNSQGYLTEHQDISNLATKAEVEEVEGKIPDVSNFATKDEIPSLDGYATESWVEGKGYLTEHQSLDDCIKKSEVKNAYNLTVNAAGQIRAVTNFTPSSTNDNLNIASLGTVKIFYNDLKDYVDGLIGTINTITEDILS